MDGHAMLIGVTGFQQDRFSADAADEAS